MKKLPTNIYNDRQDITTRKLKRWKYAGLMLTYKCSASCKFCYYNCSPISGGLMPIETAIFSWKSLIDLAGDEASVHITGGEPFLYFDHMAELVTRAKDMGLGGFDLIETNGSWATDENIITDRINILDAAGMSKLRVSWDMFHAEFIDQANVELLVKTAIKMLGADRVQVKWEKYLQNPVKSCQISAEELSKQYKLVGAGEYCRFTGRAGGELAELVADKTVEDIAENKRSCSFLGAKGVHIDPFGNVFSGLCSGMIIGNVNDKPLAEIWKNFDPERKEFFEILFKHSPAGLVNKAVEMGYHVKDAYAGKCHLCSDLRLFFFDNKQFRPIIGPSDCYGRRLQEFSRSI